MSHAQRAITGDGPRILVVGSSGSGKTTLAGQLTARLGIPHVELDALHWEAGWIEAPDALMRERVAAALAGPGWVIDGNYSQVRDLTWGQADTFVWLDYGLPLILARLSRRTFGRILTRAELWHGNRESLRNALFSRDSLFLWTLSTYRRRRRDYPALLRQPEYAHLTVLRFATPRATARWLASLPAAAAADARPADLTMLCTKMD